MEGNGHHGRRAIDVRPRRPADIPALVDVLWAQQPTSQYPLSRPLPIPVEQFMHADDAVAAWTAELAGRPVGHVRHVRPPYDFPDAAEMNRTCARAHGCDVDRLAWVCTLFVGLQGRGLGIGRRLLGAVIEDIRAAGLHPCLEVLPIDHAASSLYRSAGWHEVMRRRPEWLRQAVGDDGPDVQVMTLTNP